MDDSVAHVEALHRAGVIRDDDRGELLRRRVGCDGLRH